MRIATGVSQHLRECRYTPEESLRSLLTPRADSSYGEESCDPVFSHTDVTGARQHH